MGGGLFTVGWGSQIAAIQGCKGGKTKGTGVLPGSLQSRTQLPTAPQGLPSCPTTAGKNAPP